MSRSAYHGHRVLASRRSVDSPSWRDPVWLILEARQEVVERLVREIKAHGDEVQSLEIEKGLSPDALRFCGAESVELQLLSSEQLLRVPLSMAQLRDIAEQQSVVPYLPLCIVS